MSVETIAARVADVDARVAALRAETGPARLTPTTSFAGALSTAQRTAPIATAASVGAGPYTDAINAAATRNGVDPALLRGLVRQESGFDPTARSSAGAVGLTQLMPDTAQELGVDPTDPLQSLDGGARYLRAQLDRFGGDPSMALAAYNAGPGAVARFGGVPPYAETQRYVQRVLGFADEYRGAGAQDTSVPPIPTPPVTAGGLDYSIT